MPSFTSAQATVSASARFAKQVHAEAHALVALRDAHHRARRALSIDQVLADLNQMIATRVQRLNLPPDALGDLYESLSTANELPDPARTVELKRNDRVMRVTATGNRFGSVLGSAGNQRRSSGGVYVRWDGDATFDRGGPVPRNELLHVGSDYCAVIDAVTGTRAHDVPTSASSLCSTCGTPLRPDNRAGRCAGCVFGSAA